MDLRVLLSNLLLESERKANSVNMILLRIGILVIGYLFGMIQTAYFYGKAHGIDIRNHGSGNAGTTNTLRVLGKKAGLVVFVGDMAKTCLPVLLLGIAIDLFFPGLLEYKYLLKLYMGLGAILGHNFPFYLNFRGGKGIAASGGMMLGYQWSFVPVGFVLFFGIFAITNYVSLGSLCLLGGFFVQMLVMSIFKLGPFAMISANILVEMCIVAFVISTLAFVRHHENIKRLINHNERKTYIFKKCVNKEVTKNE